jgi:hypothetical protein
VDAHENKMVNTMMIATMTINNILDDDDDLRFGSEQLPVSLYYM